MKNTAEVCLRAGGVKPPESGPGEENPTSNAKKMKRGDRNLLQIS